MAYSNKQIYLLLGASGTGKTTIGHYLKSWGVPEVVSHTTRPMRYSEVEGRDYYFVTEEEFNKIDFIERVEYDGNLYGVSRQEVERVLSNTDKCFVVVSLEGVFMFKEAFPGICTVIYIWVPVDEMINRMKQRGDKKGKIIQRLQHTILNRELDNLQYADYCIINRDLSMSLSLLRYIVFFY